MYLPRQEDGPGGILPLRAEAKPGPLSLEGRTMRFFLPSVGEAPDHMRQYAKHGKPIGVETPGRCSSFFSVTPPHDFRYRETAHGKTPLPVFPSPDNVGHFDPIGKGGLCPKTEKSGRKVPHPGQTAGPPPRSGAGPGNIMTDHSSDRRFSTSLSTRFLANSVSVS